MTKLWLKCFSYYKLNIISMSIAICLITALFSTIVYFGMNALTVFEKVSNSNTKNWNFVWRNIDDTNRDKLANYIEENDSKIEEAVFEKEIGTYTDDIGVNVELVSFSNTDAISGLFNVSLTDGRYPTNSNEIAINQEYLDLTGMEVDIGDTMSILGNSYTVVGVINGYSSFESKYCFIVMDSSPSISNMYVCVSSNFSRFDTLVIPVYQDMIYILTGSNDHEIFAQTGIQDIGNRENSDLNEMERGIALHRLGPALIVAMIFLFIMVLVFVKQLVDTLLERRMNDISILSICGLQFNRLKSLLLGEILFLEGICIPVSCLLFFLFVNLLRGVVASILPSNSIGNRFFFLSLIIGVGIVTLGLVISYRKSYRKIEKKEPVSLIKGRNDLVKTKSRKTSSSFFDATTLRNINRNPGRTIVIGILVFVTISCVAMALNISSVFNADVAEKYSDYFGKINSKYTICSDPERGLCLDDITIQEIDELPGVQVSYVARSGYMDLNGENTEIGILSNQTVSDYNLAYSEEPMLYCLNTELFIGGEWPYHLGDSVSVDGNDLVIADEIPSQQVIAADFPNLFCNEAFAQNYIDEDTIGTVRVYVDTDMSFSEFKDKCEEMDGYSKYLSMYYEPYGAGDILREARLITTILNIVSVMLCLFVFICETNIIEQIVYNRSREFAVLEALGETPRSISHSIGMEFGIITCFATLFALLLNFTIIRSILSVFKEYISYKNTLLLSGIFIILVYLVSYGFSYYRISRSALINRLKEE